MMIHLEVSDDQYSKLKELAVAKERTVEEYILDELGITVEPYMNTISQRVATLQSGTMFTVKAVMATDWNRIPRGIRLSIGRKFFKMAENGSIPSVQSLIPDSAGTMTYKKL